MRSREFEFLVKKLLTAAVLTFLFALMMANVASAGTEKILTVFHSSTGPQAAIGTLIFDKSGNLYGTSRGGGADGQGTVFEVKHNSDGSWSTDVLYSFTGGDDGGAPYAGVIFDATGNLYGTTSAGGSSSQGVVFELSPPAGGGTDWTETVLYTFPGGYELAGQPYGALVFDASGNLYGTTEFAGAYDFGSVFKLSPPTSGNTNWTETVLYSFTAGADGSFPLSGVIFDASGNLYGTTSQAGTIGGNCSLGGGVVFKLTAPTGGSTEWTQSTLYSLDCDAGGFGYPYGEVVFDKSGNLYGVATQSWIPGPGGTDGTIFELSPNADGAWTETTLTTLSCNQGHAYGGLTVDASGNLYGTTYKYPPGCGYGWGTVFELSHASGSWVVSSPWVIKGWGLLDFAGVTLDAAGNLYTVTSSGSDNYGVVFEVVQ
jgi:uncharacterized repeat protein (TIGR03803 family)